MADPLEHRIDPIGAGIVLFGLGVWAFGVAYTLRNWRPPRDTDEDGPSH